MIGGGSCWRMLPSGRGAPGALGFWTGSNTSERRPAPTAAVQRRRSGTAARPAARLARAAAAAAARRGCTAAPASAMRAELSLRAAGCGTAIARSVPVSCADLRSRAARSAAPDRWSASSAGPGGGLPCGCCRTCGRSPTAAIAVLRARAAWQRGAPRPRPRRKRGTDHEARSWRSRHVVGGMCSIAADQDQNVTASGLQTQTGALAGAGLCQLQSTRRTSRDVAPSTVTARRFCDQHEMSLQTATGRSLP